MHEDLGSHGRATALLRRVFERGFHNAWLPLPFLFAVPALAQGPSYFIGPGDSPTGDQAWLDAAGSEYTEEDFESHAGILEHFSAGDATVTVGLAGIGGAVTGARILTGYFGTNSAAGTVYGRALVNADATNSVHSRMTFAFSPAVNGFGAWIFDDYGQGDQNFHLVVTDVHGQQHTSPPLAATGQGMGGVEGFLGVVAPEGIVAATIVSRVQDTEVTSYFEVDHVHVLAAPGNLPPVADAGPDGNGIVGLAFALDGGASVDPDGDPLTFQWSLVEAPGGSLAMLDEPWTSTPQLVPDVPGLYVARLVVNDGLVDSPPDEIRVVVVSVRDFAEEQTLAALAAVAELPSYRVTTNGNRQALMNFLTQAASALQAGDLVAASQRLAHAALRTDGCALRGAPDGKGSGCDWLTDCADQQLVYGMLDRALAALAP